MTLAGGLAKGGDSASGGGGAGMGGAIFNQGAVTLQQTTVTANAADGGNGDRTTGNTITTGAATAVSVNVTGSVLSGNTTTDLDADLVNGRSQNASGMTLTGANVVDASAVSHGATQTGTAITADPQLGPLADNGGLLQTMRPSTTGSAHQAQPSCSGTDELGNQRQGPSCELGALQLASTTPTVTTSAATTVTTGGATLHGTVNPSGGVTSYRFELSPTDSFATVTTIPGGGLSNGSDAAGPLGVAEPAGAAVERVERAGATGARARPSRSRR